MTGNAFGGVGAALAGTRVWAAGNTVTDNTTHGFLNHDSTVVFESAGGNAVRNNGIDTVGTITAVAPL